MFTIIIEVVLGQFISNLKAENHHYLFCFIKGCLLGLTGFLAVSYNYFNDDYIMPFNDLIFFFLITQTIGVIVLVIFLLIDYLFSDKKDEICKIIVLINWSVSYDTGCKLKVLKKTRSVMKKLIAIIILCTLFILGCIIKKINVPTDIVYKEDFNKVINTYFFQYEPKSFNLIDKDVTQYMAIDISKKKMDFYEFQQVQKKLNRNGWKLVDQNDGLFK